MKGWLKTMLKAQLKRHGLRVTYDRDDLWTPDFDLLSIIVAHAFREAPPRTFLQVGANDGSTHDPIDKIISFYGLMGVRMEPLPGPFARLCQQHVGDRNIRVVQAAIDELDGERNLWTVESPAQDLSSVSSFDRSVVEKHYPRIALAGGRIIAQRVRTISARTLLAEYFGKGEQIDILQVDTEGHDAVVVRTFVDTGLRPRLINFEHNHLSGGDDRLVLALLRQMGYKLGRYGRDTVALLLSAD